MSDFAENTGSSHHGQDSGIPERTGGKVQRSRVKEVGKILLFAIGIALLLKAFFIEAFSIPTPSMEKTLMVGDYLLVNKFVYGITTPRTIPLTSIRIPSVQLLQGYSSVKHGDIIVFEFTGGASALEEPTVTNYVKRCIGLPGDTIELAGKRVFVNGKRIEEPPNSTFESFTLRKGEVEYGIFPKGLPYNKDWWGPVIIPYSGMKVELNLSNLDQWRMFIEREGHALRFTADGFIEIDGKVENVYIVKQNYYFVLGDNRDNSEDSRYWGFVPGKKIIGKAMLVYWSWDPATLASGPMKIFEAIRFNRVLSILR